MTLRQYLALHRLKQSNFPATIGATQAAVSRYCANRVPAPEHLLAIVHATGGAVTANDFHLLGDVLNSGLGVPETAGPGVPFAAVPPAAARPTFLSSEESAPCTR
jgi:hypothetical protein